MKGIGNIFNKKIFKASSFGSGVFMGVMLICICISAALISNEIVELRIAGIIAIVTQLVASFVAAIIAIKINPAEKVVCTILTIVISLLFLIILSVSFFGGITGGFLSGIISMMIGGVCALLVNRTGKQGKRRRRGRK